MAAKSMLYIIHGKGTSMRSFVRITSLILSAGAIVWSTVSPVSAASASGVYRVYYDSASDLMQTRSAVEQRGGTVLEVLPESALAVEIPQDRAASLSSVTGVRQVEQQLESAQGSSATVPPAKGMGALRYNAEQWAEVSKKAHKVVSVEPNQLSRMRAQLSGSVGLATKVDNSLSAYFPPIGDQGSQGSCTAWASAYYFNTYTQAKDEGYNVSGGDYTKICSPAFIYPLVNSGVDNGAYTDEAMDRMNVTGCCSWTLKPYSDSDYSTWPSEAAWIEAIPRRTNAFDYIGSSWSGATDDDITLIKQRLANGELLVTDTYVYSNWYYNYPSNTTGINNGVIYASDGTVKGGHAITIVGYDDDKTYNDGTSTKSGAFLIANSWGNSWGVTNTGGVNKGFMWVSYNYFKTGAWVFGWAMYNTDRDHYKSKLYGVAGVTHAKRKYVTLTGGIGSASSPDWKSSNVISGDGGSITLSDTKRIAIDLNDGVSKITDPGSTRVFVKVANSSSASTNATMTSTDIFADLYNTGTYKKYQSVTPPPVIVPGSSGYMDVLLADDPLKVTPAQGFSISGPIGGPFDFEKSFVLQNLGDTDLAWTAVKDGPWFTISQTEGLLAAGASTTVKATPDPSITSLGAGTYIGSIMFTNTGTGIYQIRSATLEIRPLSTFSWTPILSQQSPGVPFSATITAVDRIGATVSSFAGPVSFSAYSGIPTFTGTDTTAQVHPTYTLYKTERTQVLYTPSEIGGSGFLSTLALNLSATAGQQLTNWTIRMKHTTLSSLSTAAWDASGWTTVYRNTETMSAPGWKTFNFTTPFYYDGVKNLLVDFSFNNSATQSPVYSTCTNASTLRTMYFATNSAPSDPLLWSGTNPTPSRTIAVPNLRVLRSTPITVTPASSGSFTGGTWTGSFQIPISASGVYIVADDGNGHTGYSNQFDTGDSDLQVSIIDDPDPVDAGAILTYNIRVANIGGIAASNVVLTDLLPNTLTYQSSALSQGTCDLITSGPVTLGIQANIGYLSAGSSATVTLITKTSVPETVSNGASAVTSTRDGNVSNNVTTVTTVVKGYALAQRDNFSTGSPIMPNDPQANPDGLGWYKLGTSTNPQPPRYPNALVGYDYDSGHSALRGLVFSSKTALTTDYRYRTAGFLTNSHEWLPYSSVGSNRIVRAKFYIYAEPVTTGGFNNPAAMPSFRARVAERFALTQNFEQLHPVYSDDSFTTAQELRPSTDWNKPSLYRVDLWPIAVPSLNNAGEGFLRGFEAYSLEPGDQGYICLAESSIGSYPKTAVTGNETVLRTYSARDLWIYDTRAGVESKIFNYVWGTTLPEGGFPDTVTSPSTELGKVSQDYNGIYMSSLAVPSDKIGVVTRNFSPDRGTDDYSRHPRVKEGKQYRISFHITSTRYTSQQAPLILRARCIKFAWSQKLELGGPFSAGDQNNLIATETLPGIGCMNPDSYFENGGWYSVIMHTPMSNDLRPEFPAGTPNSVRQPLINMMAGPYDDDPVLNDADSKRDIRFGADIIDTFDFKTGAENEKAYYDFESVEIRECDLVAD